MRAVRAHRFGDPDVLSYEEVPRPEPSDDEVLVRVHTAGVNPIDRLVRRGDFGFLIDGEPPWIPGWDLSGVVEAVGSEVTEFEKGDSVYGMVNMPGRGGTYAEYTTAPEEDLVLVPDAIGHTQAGGVPMVSQTAWRSLFEEGNLQEGQSVLVHGAAGGVGHMAVQFASASGARVIGTASGRDEEYLSKIGVDEFVNYRTQRFEEKVQQADLVLDTVGGEVLERSAEVLKPGGVLVTLPEEPSDGVKRRLRNRHDIETRYFSIESDRKRLERISGLIDSGEVEPTVQEVLPLSDARTAHRKSEDGHVRGKLVLDVDST